MSGWRDRAAGYLGAAIGLALVCGLFVVMALVSVRVFECVRGGQRVFSDHSCAPDADVRDIDVAGMNTYVAPPVRIVEPAALVPEPPTRARPSAPPRKASATERDSLQRAIDRLNARMRAGYSSAEGEWLRAQWKKLDDRYRDPRCLRG